jgi:hypothetical protein
MGKIAMSTIRFTTDIGTDQSIPLPEGVTIPHGPAEVIVIPQSQVSSESPASEAPAADVPRVPQIAIDLARFAEENGPTNLPPDYAINHDHYLHGAPKWIDLE